jgi:hypothetical protein
MASRLLFLFLLVPGTSSLLPAQPILFSEPLSPRIASYDISVTLDSDAKTLTGHETLTWKNTSPDIIRELRFHLYLNAFKNTGSTFIRESAGQVRGAQIPREGWGWIDVTSMHTGEGENLTPGIEFVHPDDDNAEDQTVIRVPLPHSVAPGQSVVLNIEFLAHLPRVFARTGYAENFFMVGQWFPKIGVYEAKGQRYATTGAWNCHQFHANSEFFADFGVYNVDITLPTQFVVGATGVQFADKNNGNGTKTVSFHAEDVHDFAWTASPNYADLKETWRHVTIRVLTQPQRQYQADRYFKSVKAALEYFDAHVGPYPYSTLTIVDPPYGGLAAGGMEYPTLITALSLWGLPEGFYFTEQAIVHEFGHQYWYGMSASNEFEEAWLDEGVNQYYECRIMDAVYGKQTSTLDLLGLRVGDGESMRTDYAGMSNPLVAPPATPAWKFPAGSYGVLTYEKTATLLATLERIIGSTAMDSVMKTFFRRWRFKHPSGKDFVATFNTIVPRMLGSRFGSSLDWYFDQTLFGVGTCDYQLSSIRIQPVSRLRGLIDSAGQKTSASATVGPSDSIMYKSTVAVTRVGELRLPVDVLVRFKNGKEVREFWDGRGSYKEFVYQSTSPVAWAKVDPDQKILLDRDLNNNSRTTDPPTLPVWKYTAKVLFWFQNLIQTLGIIG